MSHFNIQKFDFYPQFKNWYFKILKKFKFDYKKDVEAAQVITHILSEKEPSWDLSKILNSFQDHIKSREIIMIYGCGPSLEETVSKLKTILSDSFFNQVINLAADGASVLLREMGIPIDGIFTDLDGISEKELTIAKFIVVHAHGDNIDKILKYKESILKLKNLLVTVQVEPTDFTLNAGGFTDGDRILFFLRSFLLPNQKIYLVGMDFKGRVGKYSKPEFTDNQKATRTKQKKLKVAFKLFKLLKSLLNVDLVFINSKLKSKDFFNITIEDFVKLWD